MTPEQQEAEQRFNENWHKLMRLLYLALYFMFRHCRRRWKIVLPTLGVWSLCYGILRYLPTASWHIPAGVVIATFLMNMVIGIRDEHGRVHIHQYAVEDALKACGLWDSTHYRRPRLLAHKVLPGGDAEVTFDSSVSEDTWMQPSVESRFASSLGVRKFRRVFRDNKNQIHLMLASGQLRRPVTDTKKLVEYVQHNHAIPLGEGFDGFEAWDYTINSHIQISGITGSGKSSLLRNVMAFMAVKGFQLYLVDPKMAIDYQPIVPYLSELATDSESSLPLIEQLWELHNARLNLLLQAGYTSLEEAHRHGELLSEPFVALVVEEFMIFASGTKDKAVKDATTRCLTLLDRLGASSRASGIILVLSTQYGSVESLGGLSSMAQQLFRLSSRLSNETGSKTVLGIEGAELIPPTEKGHFVYRNGEELQHFYAYHVDDLNEILSYKERIGEDDDSSNR